MLEKSVTTAIVGRRYDLYSLDYLPLMNLSFNKQAVRIHYLMSGTLSYAEEAGV